MSLGSIVILVIVGVALFFAVRATVRGDAGDCSHCNGDCASAGCNSCNAAERMVKDMERADKKARKVQMKAKNSKA